MRARNRRRRRGRNDSAERENGNDSEHNRTEPQIEAYFVPRLGWMGPRLPIHGISQPNRNLRSRELPSDRNRYARYDMSVASDHISLYLRSKDIMHQLVETIQQDLHRIELLYADESDMMDWQPEKEILINWMTPTVLPEAVMISQSVPRSVDIEVDL
jgi:phosphatidylserine/phosphatidylglycerophosphate/cardiolipin synthase-like enzyme